MPQSNNQASSEPLAHYCTKKKKGRLHSAQNINLIVVTLISIYASLTSQRESICKGGKRQCVLLSLNPIALSIQ